MRCSGRRASSRRLQELHAAPTRFDQQAARRLRAAADRGRWASFMNATCLLVVAIIAAPVSAAEMGSIDPSIAFVATGGSWESHIGSENVGGRYRVVVTNSGWEHVRSRMELQWIVLDQIARSSRIEQATNVKELDVGLWTIAQPTFDFSKQAFIFSATAGDGTEHRFVLRPKSLGTYSLESQ